MTGSTDVKHCYPFYFDMSKLDYDDIQVKEAIKEREQCYDSIKRLKQVQGSYIQFIASDTIRFLELKIKSIDEALYKVGLGNYVLRNSLPTKYSNGDLYENNTYTKQSQENVKN